MERGEGVVRIGARVVGLGGGGDLELGKEVGEGVGMGGGVGLELGKEVGELDIDVRGRGRW